MYLTKEEENWYSGEKGPVLEWATKILVEYGEALGAERLLDLDFGGLGSFPQQVFQTDSSYMPSIRGDPPPETWEYIRKNGYAITIGTHIRRDTDHWREYGFTEKENKEAININKKLDELIIKFGIIPTHTCAPYNVGFLGTGPHFGSHMASSESSLVIFLNSIIGARLMRDDYPSLLASHITGKSPAADLHLNENRQGKILFNIESNSLNMSDYNILGIYIGKICRKKIPVLTGIPRNVDVDKLKQFGASAAIGGGLAMYHIVGVTPEAPTVEKAFGSRKPEEIISINEDQLKKGKEELNTYGPEKIDVVCLGCPHASIRQLHKYAMLIKNKKVHNNTELWIHAAPQTIYEAKIFGIADIIYAAGGKLISNCILETAGGSQGNAHRNGLFSKRMPHIKVVATDSGKWGKCLPYRLGVDLWFGSDKDCIESAIAGGWIK